MPLATSIQINIDITNNIPGLHECAGDWPENQQNFFLQIHNNIEIPPYPISSIFLEKIIEVCSYEGKEDRVGHFCLEAGVEYTEDLWNIYQTTSVRITILDYQGFVLEVTGTTLRGDGQLDWQIQMAAWQEWLEPTTRLLDQRQIAALENRKKQTKEMHNPAHQPD